MRCTSCGTDNEPDSRFCGGCGAKLAQPSRLAPTAKIPDDAAYPPPGAGPTGPRPQVPASYGPASIPPGFNPHAPASIPPTPSPYAQPSRQPTPSPHAQPSRQPTPAPVESFARAVTPAMQTPPPGSLVRAPMAPRPDAQVGSPPTQQRPPVRPAGSMAESIVEPPRRPVGLIVAILIIDLGLAGAGAVMLGKGLSAKKATPKDQIEQKDSAKPVQKSEAPPPTPTIQPASATPQTLVGAAAADSAKPAPAAPDVAAKPAAAPDVAPADADKADSTPAASVEAKSAKPSGTRAKDAKSSSHGSTSAHAKTTHASTSTGPVTRPSSGPVTSPSGGVAHPSGAITSPGGGAPEDPYGDAQPAFDLKAETSRLAAQSKAAFARCEAAQVHGSVKIAFQVLPDGSVAHAAVVDNSTGDERLGPCLASTISGWRYSPHAGAIVNSVRPFTYP